MKMNKIERTKELKKWLNKKPNTYDGICITLGRSVCGSFFDAPWTYWCELIEYFPEFKIYKEPRKVHLRWDEDKSEVRQLIMKSLKLRLNKKKDTVRQTDPKIFIK